MRSVPNKTFQENKRDAPQRPKSPQTEPPDRRGGPARAVRGAGDEVAAAPRAVITDLSRDPREPWRLPPLLSLPDSGPPLSAAPLPGRCRRPAAGLRAERRGLSARRGAGT